MYQLTEKQIDFIIHDIRARGVEMESLQHDLLDHICCIIEQQLEANGDFEHFYETTIRSFYKKDLREIEEETKTLLHNKNYYAMKKIMIVSGIISATLLTMGIILKFLHQSGASFGIVTGITAFSFIFLPLMFTLKIKEKQQSKDKLLLGIGSLVAILMSLGIMFKLMHWPGANMMGLTSVAILILLYLPINLVTGIRNPETKVNTVVSSILLVAGCGLLLSLARSPQGSKIQYIKDTGYYLRNEQLFKMEQQRLAVANGLVSSALQKQSKSIIGLCEELKSYIIEKETGQKSIDENFESKNGWLSDTYASMYFADGSPARQKYVSLVQLIHDYNASQVLQSGKNLKPIPVNSGLLDYDNERITGVLNNLVQVQLFVLGNELSSEL